MRDLWLCQRLKESLEPPIGLAEIEAAAKRLRGAILRTPAVEAPKLSALSGARIFIKYENMQATGSFKERGALVQASFARRGARAKGA